MVRTGAEVLCEGGAAALRGLRVGVVANPASLVRSRGRRVHLVDALRAAGVAVVRLYGPEHGLWSTAQDLVGVEGGPDPIFGLPVDTLYGRTVDTLTLQPQALDGVDALVFDVQDVGSRYYTYFATLCMAIDTCVARGVPVWVLDRPNPLGGEQVEGNRVDPRFKSFVSWLDLPQRHGLTMGEIARLYVAEAALPQAAVRIVACQDWDPACYFDELDWGPDGSPWYAPSPNMPTVQTAIVYPGGCLVEGTLLSEGRGTTRPFELVGAPWIDARRLCRDLEAMDVAGLSVRPMAFEPTFQKFARQVCQGVAVEVSDRRAFAAVRAGVALIAAMRAQNPALFQWRTEIYEFVADRLAIDLLMGGPHCRTVLDRGGGLDEATDDFAQGQDAFARRAQPQLLYPRAAGPLA
ncbi:MAG: DUF1343 domain-containing protein [Deltaproteobacteria bacterium]|nr:DUF1343 domain-containing protein [Deltaproteobacteria bacterium]